VELHRRVYAMTEFLDDIPYEDNFEWQCRVICHNIGRLHAHFLSNDPAKNKTRPLRPLKKEECPPNFHWMSPEELRLLKQEIDQMLSDESKFGERLREYVTRFGYPRHFENGTLTLDKQNGR